MTKLTRKQRKFLSTNQEGIAMSEETTQQDQTTEVATEEVTPTPGQESVQETVTEPVVEAPVIPVVESLPIIQQTESAPISAHVLQETLPKYLKMAQKYRTEGTPGEKGFFEVLDKFVKKMRRSHYMDEQTAVMEQVQFCQALEYIIDTTHPNLFRNFWSSVLATCAENMGDNDVFNAQNCIRHVAKWPLGQARLEKYMSLMNLIIFTAKPQDRANLNKVMSLRKLLEQDFSQQGRQNLETFYGK